MAPKLNSQGLGAGSLSSKEDVAVGLQVTIDSPTAQPNRKTKAKKRSPRHKNKNRKDGSVSFVNFTIGSPFDEKF